MSKIFAPGAYTWGNKGDAALVTAFLAWLRDDFGAESIELTSFTPTPDSRRYGVPIHHMVVRPMSTWRRVIDKAMNVSKPTRWVLSRYRLASAHLSYLWLYAWVTLYRKAPAVARVFGWRSLWTLTRAIDRSDFVFTIPGGYLLAPKETDDWWLYHIPNIRLGHLLGKRVVLGPCSIGPFAVGHRPAAARLLRSVDLILVRESRSAEIAVSLGVDPSKLIECPDVAFLHKAQTVSPRGNGLLEDLAGSRDKAVGTVGVSVREHHFPGHQDPVEMFNRYMDAVVASLSALNKEGARIVIAVQTEEDRAVSERLHRELNNSGVPNQLLPHDLTPSDLQRLYGEMDLLVGTRMHANILALSMGTPVVGIAYEPKTIGILESIGLPEWGVWIDEVDGGRLQNMVFASWEKRVANRAVAREAAGTVRGKYSTVAKIVTARLVESD